MKKTIVMTARWPDADIDMLAGSYELVMPSDASSRLEGEALVAALQDADVYAPLFLDQVDAELIACMPARLKLIASYGVGTNHIDVAAAAGKGIAVSNTPDVVTADTADLAMGLIIAAGRGFYRREKELREGRWNHLDSMGGHGRQISGRTLGVIGMGRIGYETARRARAFDMDILYHNRSRKIAAEQDLNATFCADLDALLRKADFVSLHTPLTPETHHLIDRQALSAMKDDAFLINTGRGPLIDEAALVDALKSGEIAGAGLDVYEFEPRLAEGIVELENVTLLPHIGTATVETRSAMAARVKANIDHFFETGKVLDQVNP